jgi:SMC interacting uncharacterized protein involved in chromosome segregation
VVILINELTNVPDEELDYYTDVESFKEEVFDRLLERNNQVEYLEQLLSDIHINMNTISLLADDVGEYVDEFSMNENVEKLVNEVSKCSGELTKEINIVIDKLSEFTL